MDQRPDPIFILGITPRSGTNFLQDLLCLHPDCEVGGSTTEGYLAEDFLTAHAELLVRYSNAVSAHWSKEWGNGYLGKDLLSRCLGDGIVSFLNLQLGRTESEQAVLGGSERGSGPGRVRLVAKTPSVRGLEHFHRIFPRSPLLIIVRDGRAVAESAVKTLKINHEQAAREWADGARTIIRFQRKTENVEQKYLLVRYEDLYLHVEQELRRIFDFLGLSADSYNFAAAANLPVRGSSALARPGMRVHWRPVEKSPDFDPLSQWKHWGRARHERFNWIAGTCMEHFGYPIVTYNGNRQLWNLRNRILDKFESLRLVKRTVRHLKSVRLLLDLNQRKLREDGVQVDVVVRMAKPKI